MTVGLLVLFGLLLLAFAWGGSASREPSPFAAPAPSGRACPGGHGPLVSLPTGEGRSYEVFACAHCDFVETTVHRVRSPLAYCPCCKQRALVTELARSLSPAGAPPSVRVTVTEQCQLCGHSGLLGLVVPDLRDADADDATPDNVLPFRQRSERSR